MKFLKEHGAIIFVIFLVIIIIVVGFIFFREDSEEPKEIQFENVEIPENGTEEIEIFDGIYETEIIGNPISLTYEIRNEVEKIYEGGEFYAIKFTGQFIFKGLTLEERQLLGFPTSVENEDGIEVPLKGDDLSVEIVRFSQAISPTENKAYIKTAVLARFETKGKQFADKLIPEPEEDKTIILDADEVFINTLSTREEVIAEEKL